MLAWTDFHAWDVLGFYCRDDMHASIAVQCELDLSLNCNKLKIWISVKLFTSSAIKKSKRPFRDAYLSVSESFTFWTITTCTLAEGPQVFFGEGP